MSNCRNIRKKASKYKEDNCTILLEDTENDVFEFTTRLEGLKVPKPNPQNIEQLFLAIQEIKTNMVSMEERINSNTINMMSKMEDRINSRIDKIDLKIENLRNEMNNRFDRLEQRVTILESFHQADFAKMNNLH